MFSTLGKYLLPLLLGFLGMGLALILVHSYNDHKTFHELINALARNAQQNQQAKPSN